MDRLPTQGLREGKAGVSPVLGEFHSAVAPSIPPQDEPQITQILRDHIANYPGCPGSYLDRKMPSQEPGNAAALALPRLHTAVLGGPLGELAAVQSGTH